MQHCIMSHWRCITHMLTDASGQNCNHGIQNATDLWQQDSNPCQKGPCVIAMPDLCHCTAFSHLRAPAVSCYICMRPACCQCRHSTSARACAHAIKKINLGVLSKCVVFINLTIPSNRLVHATCGFTCTVLTSTTSLSRPCDASAVLLAPPMLPLGHRPNTWPNNSWLLTHAH